MHTPWFVAANRGQVIGPVPCEVKPNGGRRNWSWEAGFIIYADHAVLSWPQSIEYTIHYTMYTVCCGWYSGQVQKKLPYTHEPYISGFRLHSFLQVKHALLNIQTFDGTIASIIW